MLQSRPARRNPTKITRPKAPAKRPRSSGPQVSVQLIPTAARTQILLVVLILLAGAISARLVYWQVVRQGYLSARAEMEQAGLTTLLPTRGTIYDASGATLATDVSANEVYADPADIVNPWRTSVLLARALNTTPKYLDQIFAQNPKYVVLDQNAGPRVSRRVENLALPGVFLTPLVQRDYPNGNEAAQVLGFVNATDSGQYGVEQYYNPILTGTAGMRSVLTDTAGHDIRLGPGPTTSAIGGGSIHLTISSSIQSLAQTALDNAVRAHAADGGSVTIIDPRTGYILAMAGDPTYNPDNYASTARSAPSHFNNPAIQSVYEPGSTFKIITMAAGLDTGTITPNTSFYDSGAFHVGTTTLHNWNMSGWGMETMTQVLQHSANVGAAWVSQRLGAARFYEYVKRFRFGVPTGVDMAGEVPGFLNWPGQKNYNVVDQYTNAFGQGIAVTPLQLIRAVAAVANGGVMMKPQIVKEVDYGGRIIMHRPVRAGRIISRRAARTLTSMLVQSAVGGEASEALVKGYNIAAKTGTANVAGGGSYIPNDTIASTVGYAPAYHPRFVILAIIDHPRDIPWGKFVAAPILHTLFQDLFFKYHIAPIAHPEQ